MPEAASREERAGHGIADAVRLVTLPRHVGVEFFRELGKETAQHGGAHG